MSYVVNAWLERENPQLLVTDSRSVNVVMEWSVDRLKALFSSGVLCLDDLRACDAGLQQTIKELFLLSYRPAG